MLPSRIFIVGYMGSGKTTMGKRLANRVGYRFIDLDQHIEKAYGLSVTVIFKEEGEARFRELERAKLEEVCGLENVVVSAGGGTPCFFDNMSLMNASGSSVYIRMTPAGLYRRLVHGKRHRPLLANLSDAEMLDFITNSLALREPFYSQASIALKGESLNPEDIIEKLIS